MADHDAPVGVGTLRTFNSAVAAFADRLAISESTGAMACARLRAARWRAALIEAAKLYAALPGRLKAVPRAFGDHLAFLLSDCCKYMDGQAGGLGHIAADEVDRLCQ